MRATVAPPISRIATNRVTSVPASPRIPIVPSPVSGSRHLTLPSGPAQTGRTGRARSGGTAAGLAEDRSLWHEPAMDTPLSALCVFCASSDHGPAAHRAAARRLGLLLAEAGVALVYGGGRVGLMGAVADAAMEAGGTVTGIIPTWLVDREVAHHGISELVTVPTMHERKALMYARADAFAVLPGGIGTIDEMMEVLTWRHLGLHAKPLVLLDIDGVWDSFLVLLRHLTRSGYVAPQVLDGYVTVVGSVEDVLPAARDRVPAL